MSLGWRCPGAAQARMGITGVIKKIYEHPFVNMIILESWEGFKKNPTKHKKRDNRQYLVLKYKI